MEAQLKTAVQSQLDGVKTGLSQLHHALKDIKEIRQKYANLLFYLGKLFANVSWTEFFTRTIKRLC